MSRNLWIKILIIVEILLGVGGCTPVTTQIPLAYEIASPTALPATVTLTATATGIPVTATPSPSPTATSQPPTETPLPTLSAEGMSKLILALMKDNGGCRLPCLWGMTPGKTDIQTLDEFMAQFYDVETSDDYFRVQDFNDIGGFSLIFNESKIHVLVDFSYYEDRSGTGLEILAMFGYLMGEFGTTSEGALDLRPIYGDALFTQTLQYYTLPSILAAYGLPEQVLLATWPDDPDRLDIKSWPFSLVLLYPAQGIFVEYVSIRERAGDHFVGCPAKSHIYLGVWDPENPLSFRKVVQKAGSVINELNIDYFKPVEVATTMTLDEFYQTFKHAENTACLETPIDLWAP